MARLLTQVLGTMSGSVGDIVFRRRGGRSYVSAHPSGYTPRTDAATVARKKQFKTAVEIAKNINSIALLKAVWPTDSTKLVSKFQKMVSVNYKLVSGVDLTGQPTLTPNLGFEMTTPVVALTANSVHFSAGQLGVDLGIETSIEKFFCIAGIIVMKSPTDLLSQDIYVLKFKTGQQNLDLITEIDVTIPLSGIDQQILAKYSVKRAFFAFLTLDDNGSVIKYSATYGS
jgi:hypothetical protein